MIIAISSAVLSVASGLASARASQRAKQFEFELEKQRKQEDAAEQAERILHQYRDPLLDAAQTLQSRIFNIVEQAYLQRYLHCGDAAEEQYARDYTVFAVAEYLCWVEILRRELRFLDVGNVERNRELLALLTKTQVTFQADSIDAPFRVFRGRQRAIAELMMIPTRATEGPRSECMGYAAFCHRLATDETFASWFDMLRADVDVLARGRDEGYPRLARLQGNLIELIDFLDPHSVRIPESLRKSVSAPDGPRRPEPAAGQPVLQPGPSGA